MSLSELKTIIAGFGGQGALFAGKVMAYAALLEGKEITWFPSYGPEMRGGTANCSVTISSVPVGSPLISHPDALIAMNQPSFDKFAPEMADDSIIVTDKDLVTNFSAQHGSDVVAIHASSIAENAELAGLANIVLLGKLWERTRFCERESLEAAIDRCVPPSKSALIEKNKEALRLGIEA